MQGNVTDLCPVGALLPRPQNFRARPWEYNKTPGVDVMDALGSSIRIDTRGREVMRILPRLNEAVNEEWISDKARQIVDGLKTQRLDRPFVRENGKLRPASWAAGLRRHRGQGQGDGAGKDRFYRRRSVVGRGPLSPPSRWPTSSA